MNTLYVQFSIPIEHTHTYAHTSHTYTHSSYLPLDIEVCWEGDAVVLIVDTEHLFDLDVDLYVVLHLQKSYQHYIFYVCNARTYRKFPKEHIVYNLIF